MNTQIIDDTAWFKKWFDSSFYHQLYAHRDENEAAEFIDELLYVLRPAAKAHMLDLGCGAGRHSRQLAAKGYNVTGLDLAASSIRTAKRSETDKLRFYRHDMRLPFGYGCFDFVFNFFTSFGYFKSESENQQVVQNISNSLIQGGRVVVDYMNAPYASARIKPNEQQEIDGVSYRISRWEDEKFIYKKIIIEGVNEFTEQVEKLSVFDFDCLFKKSGLQLEMVYGDYCLSDYDREQSPRMILVASKV